MRVLIDTNIILDLLLVRGGFDENAEKIVKLCKDNQIEGYLAAHSIINMFYILRKIYSADERRKLLKGFCEIMTVVGIDRRKILDSLDNNEFLDFEDCLQVECAKECGAEYIITRNQNDFQTSVIPAITPDMFLKNMNF